MTRRIVVSDTHVGSEIGLWPPGFQVEGGGVYQLNKYQEWLWACWQEMLEELRRLRPRPKTAIINGDSMQGLNWRDGELVTRRLDVQLLATVEVLRPLQDIVRKIYFIRGSEWHEGKAAEQAELVAAMLDAEKDPRTGQYTWPDLFGKIEGFPAHFAHHIGVSSVPLYEATIPLRELLMLLLELKRFRGPDVRMIVRSHRHRHVQVCVPPDLKAVVTPGWQLKTAFMHKRAAALLPQIGYVLLEHKEPYGITVRDRMFPLPEEHYHLEEI